jgi:hypothetical protein
MAQVTRRVSQHGHAALAYMVVMHNSHGYNRPLQVMTCLAHTARCQEQKLMHNKERLTL